MRSFGFDWYKDPRKPYQPWWAGYLKWKDFCAARTGIVNPIRRSWL